MVKKKVVKKKSQKRKLVKKKVVKKKVSKKRRLTKKTSSNKKHLVILLMLTVIIVLFFYSLYLTRQVTVKFEGKRWAIPARVYGRPLELFVGAPVTPQQLQAELRRLGYQKQKYPKAPATWNVKKNTYRVNTRSFQFWDEKVQAQSLSISFKNQKIDRIYDLRLKQEMALIRLEAPMIESIYPSHNEDRILLKYDEIPSRLTEALIEVEDRDFYQHHGVNPKSIVRALWANLRAGHVVQGGSTLTQQLVKNFFLSSERTLVRKINEALMALIVDANYEKDDVLEAYSNEIYLGQDGQRSIHGFGLASYFYFNRPLAELDLSRIALMVGLIKGPSYYDPKRHPERAKKRRNLVLDILQQRGVITARAASLAKRKGLGIKQRHQSRHRGYPAFIKLVRKQLHRDYKEQDLTSEGLRIFTTLDPWIQEQAEKQAKDELKRLEKNHHLPKGRLQYAAVIASPSSGEILALIGGRETRYSGFNRALDAIRPVGSLIKPFVYLSALMKPERYSLISSISDGPVEVTLDHGDQWKPQNYDKKSHGDVSLLTALAHSYNQATVHLGLDIGLDSVVDNIRKAGIERPIKTFPSLLLGSLSLSPLEVTQMYQTLSAGGFYSSLRTIREVLDAHDNPLQRYPLTVEQRLPATAVYLTDTVLQEVVSSGTARGLQSMISKDYRLAGKTGTTNDLRDSWFAGFSNNFVATVWVGRDDNKVAGLTGSQGAMRLWGKIIQAIHPIALILLPTNETEILWIDNYSGLLADSTCKDAVQIPFQRGYGPKVKAQCVSSKDDFFDRFFD